MKLMPTVFFTGMGQQYLKQEEEERVAKAKIDSDILAEKRKKRDISFRAEEKHKYDKLLEELKSDTKEAAKDNNYGPFSQPIYIKLLKSLGIPPTGEHITEHLGTGATASFGNLHITEEIATKVLNSPNFDPEASKELISHIVSKAGHLVMSSKFAVDKMDKNNNWIPSDTVPDSLPSIARLAQILQDKNQHDSAATAYFQNWTVNEQDFGDNLIGKMLANGVNGKRKNGDSTGRFTGTLDKRLTRRRLNNIQQYIPQNILDTPMARQMLDMGSIINIEEFRDHARMTAGFISGDQVTSSQGVTIGVLGEKMATGDMPASDRVTVFNDMVSLTYPLVTVRKVGLRIQRATVAQNKAMDARVKLAQRSEEDNRDLLNITDDLINLNLELDKHVRRMSPTKQALQLTGWRDIYVGFSEAVGSILDKYRGPVDRTLNIAGYQTGKMDEPKTFSNWVNEGGMMTQLGKTDVPNSEYDAEESSKNMKRIVDAYDKYFKDNKKVFERNVGFEKLARQYAALQIQAIYLKAKTIQGGTGGRGVSDMDFRNIERALSSGFFGTLPAQRVIYTGMRNNAQTAFSRGYFGKNRKISDADVDVLTLRSSILSTAVYNARIKRRSRDKSGEETNGNILNMYR